MESQKNIHYHTCHPSRVNRSWFSVLLFVVIIFFVFLKNNPLYAAPLPVRSRADSPTSGSPLGYVPSALNAANTIGNQNTAQTQTRAFTSFQAMSDYQAALRRAAATPANLGPNPNSPGNNLPDVVDGEVFSGVGLRPDYTRWVGATPLLKQKAGDPNDLEVEQLQSQAFLYWFSMDLGKNTTLSFIQSGTDWVAYNYVYYSSGLPTQILGTIQAPGAVYITNRHGVYFGGTSQVNVRSLVVSSLPINTNLAAVNHDLLDNPDSQFLFSSLKIAALNSMPDFDPTIDPTDPDSNSIPLGYSGDVIVQAGAQLNGTAGGLIALIGRNVTHEGSILIPDGQAILAAGQQVGLVAHSKNDPSLRGLDVFIGSVTDLNGIGGTVINNGLIEVPHGNITLAGKEIQQNGGLISSTSVNYNGRIDLLANYNSVALKPSSTASTYQPYATETGRVTLGEESLIQILTDTSAGAVDSTGALKFTPSQINIQGESIHLAGLSTILAPNATVQLSAGKWYQNTQQTYSFYSDKGQVYFDANASIDVAGSQTTDSVGRFFVEAELRSAELADSPLILQNEELYKKKVYLDMRNYGQYNGHDWVGSPLGNFFGNLGTIKSDVNQLTTAGGSVTIAAGDSVVLQPGASINVSGGWTTYTGATVTTSQLLSGSGRGQVPIDIVKATPDQDQTYYTGLTTISRYEEGYVQGANAGSVSITAPAMALDGNLYGTVMTGPTQRKSAAATDKILSATHSTAIASGASEVSKALDAAVDRLIRQTWGLPEGGTLALNFYATEHTQGLHFSSTPTTLRIQSVGLPAVDPYIYDPTDFSFKRNGNPVTSTDLTPEIMNSQGFGKLLVDNSGGSIVVPASTVLNGRPGGIVSLTGGVVQMDGSINIPGGKVTLTGENMTWLDIANSNPVYDSNRGMVSLGSNAKINVAGLFVDDRYTTSSARTLPLQTSGGDIIIQALSVELASGSSLNVSGSATLGGLSFSDVSKVVYGDGGNLSILAGQDPGFSKLIEDGGGQRLGHLGLGAEMIGYTGGKGSSLTIKAPIVQVIPGGGGAETSGDSSTPFNTLYLTSSFFNNGGFSSFTIQGLGDGDSTNFNGGTPGVHILSGVTIAPVVQTLQIDLISRNTLVPTLLAPGLRAPVSVGFDAIGVGSSLAGKLIMESGSSIVADPTTLGNSKVKLSGDLVTMRGSINAPGGSITIKGSSSVDDFLNKVTVDLGPGSTLSAAGATVLTPLQPGYRSGAVLPGGTITVSGNVYAEAGSVMNVSGTSGTLDLEQGLSAIHPGNTSRTQLLLPTTVESDGGKISLSGGSLFVMNSTLVGNAGGSSARGGDLEFSSGHSTEYFPATPNVAEANIYLTDTSAAFPAFLGLGSSTGSPGLFAAESFNGSGLDSLTLSGSIQFSGDVTLTANRFLNIGKGIDSFNPGGVIYADSAINTPQTLILNAPYVIIGQSPLSPAETLTQQANTQNKIPILNGVPLQPTWSNNGVIKVGLSTNTAGLVSDSGNRVQLVDIGNLNLQNIGEIDIATVAGGEIRGSGFLDVSGTINLAAGQIYPLTETVFTLSAYPFQKYIGNQYVLQTPNTPTGAINIYASGSPGNVPLSAGGVLNLFADKIVQGGVLRAPIGAINFGSNGAAPSDPWAVKTSETHLLTPPTEVTLKSGSITSVSGAGLMIPYGTVENGSTWKDPGNKDITTGGLPAKNVTISAATVDVKEGALIDLSGGGDLYASQFVAGLGGSYDILNYNAGSKSFAVIPGFTGYFGNLDQSKSSSAPAIGDRVYLAAGGGLSEGEYTLLPAMYALQPGAFLVTPISGVPQVHSTNIPLPDGSAQVAGYRYNALNPNRSGQTSISLFEVASPSVFGQRAQYDIFSANTWLSDAAVSKGIAPPRLPIDGGQLVFTGTNRLSFKGSFAPQGVTGGLGSLVDLATALRTVIAAPGYVGNAGEFVLSSEDLNNLNAGSLLIGGYRTLGSQGLSVTVSTNDLEVDGSVIGDHALVAGDLILVSKEKLTLEDGVTITPTLSNTPAPTLLLSGHGTLVRVSGNASAPVIRTGVTGVPPANVILSVGDNVRLGGTGASVLLDSTGTTNLKSTAILTGTNVAQNSGLISLVLDNSGTANPLGQVSLSQLLAGAQALSLSSYSSIDFYGDGDIGTLVGADYSIQNLSLHAAQFRGFDKDGNNTPTGAVNIYASDLTLDNTFNATPPVGSIGVAAGSSLNFQAKTIHLGNKSDVTKANALSVERYADLNLTAENGIVLEGKGDVTKAANSLTTQGNMTIHTPIITALSGANQTITAVGNLVLDKVGTGTASTATGGLGAILSLNGASVVENTDLVLHSGQVTLHSLASANGVTVGGLIDVSGLQQNFFDQARYTDGGQVSLISDTGAVTIGASGRVSVAAASGGGKGGLLSVSAISSNGYFDNQGLLLGQGGTPTDDWGTFSMDVYRDIIGGDVSLGGLNTQLNTGGFNQSRSFRVRGKNVLVDGTATARNFTVSADTGAITVTGIVDARGPTGGKIGLYANNSLILQSGSKLDASGVELDAAGKGGWIDLETRGGNNGVVDIQAGSTVEFGASSGGTLYLRAPQTSSNTDLAINAINGAVNHATSIVAEGYRTYTNPTGGFIDSLAFSSFSQQTLPQVVNSTLTFGATTTTLIFPQGTNGNNIKFSKAYTIINQDGTTTNVTSFNTPRTLPAGSKITFTQGGVLTCTTNTGTGAIDVVTVSSTPGDIYNHAASFAGTTTIPGNTTAIQSRLLANNAALSGILHVRPGAEIVSTTGDLTLSTDWNFSNYRFGPNNNEPGTLTLRAPGNLVLNGSLSDGFQNTTLTTLPLYAWTPMTTDSWTFRLTAGADTASADYHQVKPLNQLAAGTGSLKLGVNVANPIATTGWAAVLNDAGFTYQVIRTGTGDIDISAGRDVLLLNQWATIYTAGKQDASSLANFDLPIIPTALSWVWTAQLPNAKGYDLYPVFYTQGGGNVTIHAGGDIAHKTLPTGAPDLIFDSEHQLPVNWLLRRGQYIDGTSSTGYYGDSMSTTWWVDFMNFFEGIGALGGGNVSLIAGHDVYNVDGLVPTNARLPKGRLTPANWSSWAGAICW